MNEALKKAVSAVGTVTNLADQLGIRPQAVFQWKACPPLRVLEIERITGIPRHVLRPDIYPPPVAAE